LANGEAKESHAAVREAHARRASIALKLDKAQIEKAEAERKAADA
jgi:hypothetical protein